MLTVILDGNNLLYRIIKAKAYPDLATSSGEKTGGVYGVIQSVHKVWNTTFPTYGILVFDGGLSERRRALYPDYKKRTEGEDPEADEERNLFYTQKRYISEILGSLGIPTIEVPGKEADDVIDYIVHWILWHGGMPKVVIVSEDIDLCQIVGRSTDQCEIELHRPIRGEIMTRHTAREQLGHPLEHYALYKALVGKPREVKGVEGVGQQTAIRLINDAQLQGVGVRELVQGRVDEGSKKPMKRLRTILDGWDDVERGRKLSMICLETFTEEEQRDIQGGCNVAFNPVRSTEMAKEILNKLEFMSIVNTFQQWTHPFLRGTTST